MSPLRGFIKDNFTPPRSQNANGRCDKPRIEFIDLAKGVVILMVVCFHTLKTESNMGYLRMPLYFVLSGLFFKDYGGLLQLALRKLNRLIVPFLFFAAIAYGIWLIYCIYHPVHNFAWSDIPLLPFRDVGKTNVPLWFLPCLFWCNLIFALALKFTHSKLRLVAFTILCGIAGWWLIANDLFLPYHLDRALRNMPFFAVGYLIRNTRLLYTSAHDMFIAFMGLMILLLWYFVVGDSFVDFDRATEKQVVNPLIQIVVSTALVCCMLLMLKPVKWLPIVSYFGRYSVIVLGIHYVYLRYFDIVPSLYLPPYLRCAVILALCWVTIPVFLELFPQFTAQRDLIKSRFHNIC